MRNILSRLKKIFFFIVQKPAELQGWISKTQNHSSYFLFWDWRRSFGCYSGLFLNLRG